MQTDSTECAGGHSTGASAAQPVALGYHAPLLNSPLSPSPNQPTNNERSHPLLYLHPFYHLRPLYHLNHLVHHPSAAAAQQHRAQARCRPPLPCIGKAGRAEGARHNLGPCTPAREALQQSLAGLGVGSSGRALAVVRACGALRRQQ